MLDHLTIRMKLMLLSAAFFSLLLALGSAGLWNVYQLQDMIQLTYTNSQALRYQGLVNAKSEAIRSDVLLAYHSQHRTDQSADEKKKILSSLQNDALSFKRSFEHIERLDIAPEAKNQIATLRPLVQNYLSESEKIATAALNGTAPASDLLLVNFSRDFEHLNDAMDKLSAVLDSKMISYRQEAGDTVTTGYKTLGITILLTLGLSCFIAWRLGQSILRRVQTASDVVSRIAHGDLRQAIDIGPQDEMGHVLKSMQKMQGHLTEMLRVVFDSSRRILHASETFRGMVSDIADSSHVQTESTTRIASSAQELTQSVHKVLDQTDGTHGATHESARICDHSLKAMSGALYEMNNIVQVVQRASGQVQQLETSSSRISEIAQVIKEIADQTSLLALNAAIEAARAGEQGRGFAVVADEVRKLSERTAESTIQITMMIEEIMIGISEAVSTMHMGTEHVQQGVKVTQDAHEAMSQISVANQNLIELVNDISHLLRAQNESAQLMTTEATEVATIAGKNSANTQDATVTVNRLKELADELQKATNTFQLG